MFVSVLKRVALFEVSFLFDSQGERISCPGWKTLSITRWLIQEGEHDSSMRLKLLLSLMMAPSRLRHHSISVEKPRVLYFAISFKKK